MSATAPPRLYYMPRTRSSRVLWMLDEAPLFAWTRELGTAGEIGPGAPPSPARERFAQAAAALQAALDGRDWLVDGRFGVGDVLCASILAGAHSRELLAPWPGLEAYVQRGQARPAYVAAAAIWDRPRRP